MSTLKRALAILDLFSLERPSLSAEQIIDSLGYSAPTGYRYIRDLTQMGYLLRITGGSYKLGPRIIELDHLIIDGDPVLKVAQPIMRDIVARMDADLLLSAVYGKRLVHIHHERGPMALDISYGRGKPHPIFRGAAAKVILAFRTRREQQALYAEHAQEIAENGLGQTRAEFLALLDTICKQGYHLSRSELSANRVGIAVPVFEDGNRIFGSLTLTFLQDRLETISLEKTVALLQGASRRIETLAMASPVVGVGALP